MECDRPACALGLQHRDGHFGEICALCIWCEENYTVEELQAKNVFSLQRLIDIVLQQILVQGLALIGDNDVD